MAEWPKDKMLLHGSDLPMEERIRRYQHNIKAIREAGCSVPTPSMIDSLDPAEIELWFADSAFMSHRLESAIHVLADTADNARRTRQTATVPRYSAILI